MVGAEVAQGCVELIEQCAPGRVPDDFTIAIAQPGLAGEDDLLARRVLASSEPSNGSVAPSP